MSTMDLFRLPDWLKEIFADSFKKYLVLVLCLLGLSVYAAEQYLAGMPNSTARPISFFYHPQCPHCERQKEFNPYLKAKYPELQWSEYDTSQKENLRILSDFLKQSGRSQDLLEVPVTFIGPYVISGFDSAKTTGITLEKAIYAYLKNDPSLFDVEEKDWHTRETIDTVLFGEIRLADYSLFALAVIMGLLDGFNPCAMWVLVYLISLIMTLNDRRKVWFLVGSFVLASGILYFLFMAAWLNVFLILGYLRILTLIVGLVAIGAGILNIREYIVTKGNLVCKVGDVEAKKRTMGKIDRIVYAPISFFSLVSIVALSFIVNSIEFVCSAAMPAIFTHTLALRDLAAIQYYSYILIYDLFFMLDDLIIFSLAVLALDTKIGHHYAKYCMIIGGVVLLILGVFMVFQPGKLR